jgi:hypothetical protein
VSEEEAQFLDRLAEYARGPHSPVEVVGWIHGELEQILGERYSAYSISHCLFVSFDLDMATVRRALRWAGLGWGGNMSDEDLNELLGHLTLRPRRLGRYQ